MKGIYINYIDFATYLRIGIIRFTVKIRFDKYMYIPTIKIMYLILHRSYSVCWINENYLIGSVELLGVNCK